TPGQRESFHRPLAVVAAGKLEDHPALPADPLAEDPHAISALHRLAKPAPCARLTGAARCFVAGGDLVIEGKAGEAAYVTFDFQRPMHGFVVLETADATPGTVVDIGYGEIVH